MSIDQISAVNDACMRKRLMELAARRNWGQINVPQILLALLHGVFRSDFPSEKAYMQWKLRQVINKLWTIEGDKTFPFFTLV